MQQCSKKEGRYLIQIECGKERVPLTDETLSSLQEKIIFALLSELLKTVHTGLNLLLIVFSVEENSSLQWKGFRVMQCSGYIPVASQKIIKCDTRLGWSF